MATGPLKKDHKKILLLLGTASIVIVKRIGGLSIGTASSHRLLGELIGQKVKLPTALLLFAQQNRKSIFSRAITVTILRVFKLVLHSNRGTCFGLGNCVYRA